MTMSVVQQALRTEVALLRARESRRVFDAMVCVGRLGAARESFVVRAQDLPAFDEALRVEVLSRLLEQAAGRCGPEAYADPPATWIARAGLPELHDADLRWMSAATIAFGQHGLSPAPFYVVTRTGWLDPRTGESRTWKRLRI